MGLFKRKPRGSEAAPSTHRDAPFFRYHPDPIATGSLVETQDVCERCGEARGLVYSGPTYAVDEIEFVCAWCIADGSAAREFSAEFTTVDGAPSDVPSTVVDEVLHRTPGFAGWQQERWLFHCSDAAEFLGRISFSDVADQPDVLAAIAQDGWRPEALPHMSVDGDLTGYLFRCRHCGSKLAYADAS